MLLLAMKSTWGPMTQLGLRRESAWPQVYGSGCTDGDTHGASVKGLFVSILLHICERELSIDGRGRERTGLKFYVVMHLI